jgi:hypothetical protein
MSFTFKMVPIYVKLVEAGRRTLEEVPEEIREEVRAVLGLTPPENIVQ